MKLLIVEDDAAIVSMLKKGLEEEGFVVDVAKDAEEAEYLLDVNKYDIMILDWMLPNKSGIEFLRQIRGKGDYTPVLLLTAKSSTTNKVDGLNAGADDYLTKPFSFDELLARLNAIYRRSKLQGHNKIIIDNILIDLDSKTVKKDNQLVELTAKEYELLEFLAINRGHIVSNEMIQQQLWNNEEFITSNVIQVIVYRLRNKLSKQLIKSKRNLGYFIE
ncbi:MAG: response regulator transcription factor [Epsilonproteobacteria bacterium]|jgi:DNA-binding response OmpR family regulator|nr:response regulator transcription factor [Campylobacterota bacterium]